MDEKRGIIFEKFLQIKIFCAIIFEVYFFTEIYFYIEFDQQMTVSLYEDLFSMFFRSRLFSFDFVILSRFCIIIFFSRCLLL